MTPFRTAARSTAVAARRTRGRTGNRENAGRSVDAGLFQEAHVRPLALYGDASLGIGIGGTPAASDESATRTLDDFISGRVRDPDGVRRLDTWMVRHFTLGFLDFSFTVERFPPNADSNVPFHRRGTAKIRKFSDDFLPRHSVYVLNAGESFQIRIAIGRDCRLRFPLREVVSLEVIPPDGEGQSVEVWQRNRDHEVDALGFVQPGRFGSKRLNRKCPVFGLVDAKYVRLTIHVTFRLGDGFPHDMEAYSHVYLQLKRPPRLLKLIEKLREWKGTAKNTSGARRKLRRRKRACRSAEGSASFIAHQQNSMRTQSASATGERQ